MSDDGLQTPELCLLLSSAPTTPAPTPSPPAPRGRGGSAKSALAESKGHIVVRLAHASLSSERPSNEGLTCQEKGREGGVKCKNLVLPQTRGAGGTVLPENRTPDLRASSVLQPRATRASFSRSESQGWNQGGWPFGSSSSPGARRVYRPSLRSLLFFLN